MAFAPFFRLSLQAAQPEVGLHTPATSTAACLEPVAAHLHILQTRDLLQNIAGFIKNLECPAKIAWIVVCHLFPQVSFQFDSALINQLF